MKKQKYDLQTMSSISELIPCLIQSSHQKSALVSFHHDSDQKSFHYSNQVDILPKSNQTLSTAMLDREKLYLHSDL